MTITEHPPARSGRTVTELGGRLARSALYCAGLVPVSVAALIAVLIGRSAAGAGLLDRWQRRAFDGPYARRLPSAFAVVGNTVSGLFLGALALIPLGMELLLVARGALYGLVDKGPYDGAWGGPSLPGAWAAHFLISVPFAIAGLFTLLAIAALHRRWGRLLDGDLRSRWVVGVTVLAGAAAALLVKAWLHQI